MKRSVFYVISSLVLSLLSVISLSSCNKDPEINSDASYEYTPSGELDALVDPSDTIEQTTESILSENLSGGKYTVNNDWKENYSVSYSYRTEQIAGTMKCTEKKGDGAFIVEEANNSKTIQYYKADGDNVDYYVIIEGEEEQAHTVLENTDFSLLESFFMKKFCIDSDLRTAKNALYMCDETVAGRLCCKYILAEYKDGERTQQVYLWIDVQYGFIAKLEVYDANGHLTEEREVIEFSAGNITDDDVYIDLSQYEFKEAE